MEIIKLKRLTSNINNLQPLDTGKKKEAEHLRVIKELLIRINGLENKISKLTNFNKKISIPSNDGCIILALNDIIYMEATGSYTNIYLKSNEKLLISKTLKHIETLISDNQFLRIHNSYSINTHYIQKLIKKSCTLIQLQEGIELSVSRGRKTAVLEWFNKEYNNM